MLTVAQLIEELRQFPQDAEITTASVSAKSGSWRGRLTHSARVAKAAQRPVA